MLKQKKINLNHKFGFTLVELLITVTILGILSTVAYVGVGEIRKTIRDNKRRADLNEVARALELFKADYGQYPTNTYFSIDYIEPFDENYLMPFLKNGGNVDFVYPGNLTGVSKDVSAGYLKEEIKDPLNQKSPSSWSDSHMYAYYGANWANALNEIEIPATFPMACPNLVGVCGLLPTEEENWDDCCNDGGCYNPYCDYNTLTGEISFSYYSLNTWSSLCYGDGTTRSLSLLMTRLEKESKPEERINDVFAFCPTADPSHPQNANFLKLKAKFPRGKDCYDGNPSNYGCVDTNNGTPNHQVWSLDNFNYFVPLTGEFNLR